MKDNKIRTVGDLRRIISDLDDNYEIDLRVRRHLTDEEVKNIRPTYPYPYITDSDCQLEFDDIGVSDKVLCIGVEVNWDQLGLIPNEPLLKLSYYELKLFTTVSDVINKYKYADYIKITKNSANRNVCKLFKGKNFLGDLSITEINGDFHLNYFAMLAGETHCSIDDNTFESDIESAVRFICN